METKLVEMMMRVYYWMKGAAYFWLGWLAGLGLFGTMASLTALTEAHQNAKWRADLLTFSSFGTAIRPIVVIAGVSISSIPSCLSSCAG